MEPPIIAVCARNIDCAQKLLGISRGAAGLKNGAIRGVVNDKVLLSPFFSFSFLPIFSSAFR
jgi:tRNA(Phe) wybutosine-synthesizing methylase Tyw3